MTKKIKITCPGCNGSGKIDGIMCDICDGEKTIEIDDEED